MTADVGSKNITISVSIKLVASILIVIIGGMASIVLYQAMNKGGEGPPATESLDLINPHVWVRDNLTEAAIVVVNKGESEATISRITIRGMECNWTDVYYWKNEMGPISDELMPTSTALTGSSCDISVDGVMRVFQQASSELALGSQWTAVLYINNPGNVTAADASRNVTMTIFAESHLYYKVAIVDTQSFMDSSSITITDYNFYGTSGSGSNYINVTMKNTGTKQVTISNVKVNNAVKVFTGTTVLNAGDTGKILRISNVTWTNGLPYKIELYDSSGSIVASTQPVAPGT